MKLITFRKKDNKTSIGWLQGNDVVDMQKASPELPGDMLTFIDHHETYFDIIEKLGKIEPHFSIDEVKLLPPLPNPRSVRDYIGFEMHMLNASRSFGHSISEVWYEMPIYYFTNHQAIYGPEDEIARPPKETKMDLELEIAAIIGKGGKDIEAGKADAHIFGYTIFNDWTARAIQKREMEMPLGPCKGKDFANAFGPCIVTADEFEQYRVPFSEEFFNEPLRTPERKADRFNVKMEARINGVTVCEGNYKTVYHSFGEMIERASENGVQLMPGDILGSGTVGWGSLIENKFSVHRPIVPGDVVELEIEGIGVLRNKVI
ncbi:fumarylacetoacetate hydrolase family protein [Jiulongibacter sediminis]|uniref:Fumarylacetoacetase n=1 Tax=Jiulongibacter sediminis TaxID=1605367 RepID=A0A0P7C6P2_9BACT|nr:fumarylacetoacetate hydrolase family protein [Jiulongibacter sediminis]KPM49077.1 fumarylacetoacetase [Jiulongibacter sediminis]TBX25593.1 fumarylacetoacetase [Jiulongibacter sediminis]